MFFLSRVHTGTREHTETDHLCLQVFVIYVIAPTVLANGGSDTCKWTAPNDDVNSPNDAVMDPNSGPAPLTNTDVVCG